MTKRKDVEKVELELVVVRFLTRDAPFEAGDERAFPKPQAEKFIRQGVAEEVVGG